MQRVVLGGAAAKMRAIPETFVECFGIYANIPGGLLNPSKEASAMGIFTLKKKITGTLSRLFGEDWSHWIGVTGVLTDSEISLWFLSSGLSPKHSRTVCLKSLKKYGLLPSSLECFLTQPMSL